MCERGPCGATPTKPANPNCKYPNCTPPCEYWKRTCDICGKNQATHTVKNTTPRENINSKYRWKISKETYHFCEDCLETLKPGANNTKTHRLTVEKI